MTYKKAFLTFLPRAVAEAAINNRIRQEGNGSENDPIEGNLNTALSDAFIWKNTPEKDKYWTLVNEEFLSNIEQYF